MFTVATALTRLAGGIKNLFVTPNGTMSAGQQLARLNECISKFYERGTWRGVHTTVPLTSTSGIITLAEAYLRLDGLQVTTSGKCGEVEINGQQWEFQKNGPGLNTTRCFDYTAVDLGDSAGGLRQYRLTGSDATSEAKAAVDAMTFTGLARKRFVYITDTATVVVPDCYSALEIAVRAMNATDNGAHDVANALWAQAFDELDSDLGEFEQGNDPGFMSIHPDCAVQICNLV